MAHDSRLKAPGFRKCEAVFHIGALFIAFSLPRQTHAGEVSEVATSPELQATKETLGLEEATLAQRLQTCARMGCAMNTTPPPPPPLSFFNFPPTKNPKKLSNPPLPFLKRVRFGLINLLNTMFANKFFQLLWHCKTPYESAI